MAWKLFTLTLMEKSEAEKSPWVKKTKKKNRPKEKRNSSTCQVKEKILTECDNGSWFGRTPSTISASAEDPERSNILGASSLKSKSASVQVANKILRRNLAEAMKRKKNATLTVPNTGASILYRLVFQWHIIFLVNVLPLPLGSLPIIYTLDYQSTKWRSCNKSRTLLLAMSPVQGNMTILLLF